MELVLSIEVWAVFAAVPCLAGWILGHRFGSARALAVSPAPKAEPTARAMQTEHRGVAMRSPPEQFGQTFTNMDGATRTLFFAEDRASLTDLPDVSDLETLNAIRDHAKAIRLSERIWDKPELVEEMTAIDPSAKNVLSHFGRSVAQIKTRHADYIRVFTDGAQTQEAQAFYDVPRLTDIAPISMDADLSEHLENRRYQLVQPSLSSTRV